MASQGTFNDGMILPSLIDQLKSILHQYPDDGQIVKELLQNADDAGASHVRLMLDETQYGTDKLFSPDMAQYQGAALYAFNNAKFTSEDWDGIRMMYASVKEKDALKVGRFGLGFKSLFHMTDVPSLVSGSGIAFIDPHEALFRKDRTKGRPTSSYKWEMEDHREDMMAIPDQWQPYKHAIFNFVDDNLVKGKYEHTLFRFPLRTPQNESDLSNTCYTPEKILKLFHSLEIEGHLDLIFLQHLESIEVYHKKGLDEEPSLLFAISINSDCLSKVRKYREIFQSAKLQQKSESVVYNLDVEVMYGKILDDKADSRHSYIICQHLDKPEKSKSQNLQKALGTLPIVGVALPLNTKDVSVSVGGQLFCFMPFPLQSNSPTGYNFHVNGYFAVDQNRRHLKWPTADQESIDDKSILWNIYLVEKLLPKALCALIDHSAKLILENKINYEQVTALFPNKQLVKANWDRMLTPFYKKISQMEVFFSKLNRGSLIQLKNAIFYDDELFGNDSELIFSILIDGHKPMVKVPTYILDGLRDFDPRLVQITDVYEAFLAVQHKDYTEKERASLLRYLLSSPNIPLDDLKLLPLMNGTWTSFNNRLTIVYIVEKENDQELLPKAMIDKFVNMSTLDEITKRKMIEFAKSGKNPQPGLATRMLKQAKHDLTSIINDIQGPSGRFNEWICIKCYQATENALKGGQVSVDVNQKFDTSLLSLCWHDDDLKYLVRKMEAIIDNGKLTYPHFTYRGLLPHEHYSEADAKEAQEIAYQVLGIATKYTQCK